MQRIELPRRAQDLSKMKFGRITPLYPVKDKQVSAKTVRWFCRCDCGVEWVVSSSGLRNRTTVSCGCLRKERGVIRCKELTRHGMSYSPEWQAWSKMKGRCDNRNGRQYKDWGGRGIIVCDRWRESFENFLSDVGQRPSKNHSIDRYPDQNGNYEPGNVRWATRIEQNRNKRDNVIVTAFGVTQPLVAFFDKRGPAYKRAHKRIVNGWHPEGAIAAPVAGWLARER